MAVSFTYIVCGITSIIFLQCSISTNPFSFGCAKRLISDQGREFINKFDTELQLLGAPDGVSLPSTDKWFGGKV